MVFSRDFARQRPGRDAGSEREAPLRELDRVRTLEVVSGEDGEPVPAGSEGTIVAVWNGGEAFEVEFMRPIETLAAIDPKALQLIERADG